MPEKFTNDKFGEKQVYEGSEMLGVFITLKKKQTD